MKKIILTLAFLSIALNIFPAQIVSGQTPSPTEAEEKNNTDTLERIRDLVASKVAELDLVERRGILGIVKSTSSTQISITDHSSETRNIDIDELTEFENEDDDDFGISDIENGTEISVVGLFNKDNKRLLARFVEVVNNIPLNIDGQITGIDREEFTITIATGDNRTITVDIETSTDTYLYDEGETNDSGYSRLEVGQRAIVVGFADENEENHMSASRVIHFGSIPPSVQISEIENEENTRSSGDAGSVEAITND